jgi:hypothetical protein
MRGGHFAQHAVAVARRGLSRHIIVTGNGDCHKEAPSSEPVHRGRQSWVIKTVNESSHEDDEQAGLDDRPLPG